MTKKQNEFHIITVGNSIITNYKRITEREDVKQAPMMDEEFWSKILKDESCMNEIYKLVDENPKEMSAELNSFLRYCEKYGINNENVEVCLVGTETASNNIALNILVRYFEAHGFASHEPVIIPKVKSIETPEGSKEFGESVIDVMYNILRIGEEKKEKDYKVVVNPTGGFKAHVIAAAIAGFFLRSEVYYIHEEFKELAVLPPLVNLALEKYKEEFGE